MTSASDSTGTQPEFRLRPYRNAAIEAISQGVVRGNFRAGEPAILEAYDKRNIDDNDSNDADSCFSFSVVKNL